ncbi:MAG: inorganic phosphate transporter [Myxococcota bacterium]
MDLVTIVLAVTATAGLYMAWNIGANDVANAMGTSVGSGALTLRSALIVAAVFEFGGALLVGGSVTRTISGGIVGVETLAEGGDAMLVAVGMTCCLLAAALWLHIATYFGWPVSTTHSIVGSVLGFGLWAGGVDVVRWGVMGSIAASWVLSPALGGLLGFAVFSVIRARILRAEDAVVALQRLGPVLVFPIGLTLALAMIFRGLQPLRMDQSLGTALPIAVAVGLLFSALSVAFFRSRRWRDLEGSESERAERVFRGLQVVTACYVAFAHGSNDVANAVGPMAAVFGAVQEGLSERVEVPLNVLMIGAFGIVLGLSTYGFRVMATIGREITELTPSRGFAAEFAAATTIVIASKLALPISTTHTVVGAVVGVGFARSFGALNLRVLRGIVASWLFTVPVTAALSATLVALASLALGR